MEYIKNIKSYINNGFTFSVETLEFLINHIFNYILRLFKDVFIYTLVSITEAIGFKKDMIKINDDDLSKIYNNLSNLKKYIPDVKPNFKLLCSFTFLYVFNTLYILTSMHNVIIFPTSFFYNLWFNNIFLLLCFIFYYGSIAFYDIFISKKNLSISVLFISSMLVTIFLPKKYIITIIICVILIILNIFMLINLIN